MAMLIDLEYAKLQLQVEIDDDDERLTRAIEEASSAILDWCHLDTEPSDVPGFVVSATVIATKVIFDKLGDDPLTDAVKNLLRRYRDPAFA